MAAPVPAAPTDSSQGLLQQLTELDTRFWIVNTMEMFERLAYYGVRTVIPLYMVLPVESGGPEFSHVQKGAIFAAWAAVQSLLPMFTGGFADRYGHKRTIAAAIVLKIVGYLGMAHFKDYGPFFLGCMLLAAGTAIFKPGVQGTLAATLKKSSASVGWGIFYQLVNVGGFLGPVLAGVLRLMDWIYVFYACAVIVSINFAWLPFYKDPTQEGGDHHDPAVRKAEEDALRRSWGSLAQAVETASAARWAAFFSAVSLAWFAVTFGVGAFVTDLVGLEGGPAVSVGLSVALGVVGGLLSLLGLVGGLLPAARRVGELSLWAAFLLSVVAIAAGLEDAPAGALVAAGQAHAGLWAPMGTFATSGLYLAPIGALLGGALSTFARGRERFDQGALDPWSIFVVSMAGLFQPRVLWFCLVFSGFWLMFNQVFDLLPNVMDDWVDSSGIILAMGHAFSSPAVPWGLGVVLGLVYGAICAVIVLLAMRPDHRPTTQVSRPAWAVVAIALSLAGWFLLQPVSGRVAAALSTGSLAGTPVPGLAGLLVVLGAGALLAVGAALLKAPARLLAGLALLVGGLGAAWAIGRTLTTSAQGLVQMAEAGQQVNPEWLINLNPGLIVFTMIFFAWLSGKVKPLTSIIAGMAIATAGSVLAGTATVGWICLAGVLVFSVGEMLSSPKKMEYLAGLAKKGQEGLFMGYANVPVAIGWISGSIFAGSRYEEQGDKANLARRYLVESQGWTEEAAQALPRSEVVTTLAQVVGQTPRQVQDLLFQTYHPERLWIDIGLIGLVSIVGMVIYDRVLRRVDRQAT
ncbi:MFS transporter [Myxococcota bacterium]|nr:MFS transporter [Myxococcota bacterium]